LRLTAELNAIPRELDLSPADPGDVEEVVDEPGDLSDLAIDDRSRSPGLLASRRRTLGIIGMKGITPTEVGALLLGDAHEPEEGLAGVGIAAVRGADP
jgi:hypothetical protein